MEDETVYEMVRVVSRLCGVAIALLIIIPLFNAVLGIDYRSFFEMAGVECFRAAAMR